MRSSKAFATIQRERSEVLERGKAQEALIQEERANAAKKENAQKIREYKRWLAFGKASIILLKIRVSNLKVLPTSLQGLPVVVDGEAKISSHDGKKTIPPTENCFVGGLLLKLETHGFGLTNAYIRETMKMNNGFSEKVQSLNFIFTPSERLLVSEDYRTFQKTRGIILDGLRNFLHQNLWKVEAYENPFCADGRKMPGEFGVSINLANRIPLFDEKGRVMVWKDKERTGKIPLRGKCQMPITRKGKPFIVEEKE